MKSVFLRNPYTPVVLFLAQMAFIFNGKKWFPIATHLNPTIILILSLSIPALYFLMLLQKPTLSEYPSLGAKKYQKWIGGGLGLFSIALFYEELRKILKGMDVFSPNSDVMTQLFYLYDRFHRGRFPYSLVVIDGWGHSPYPVYMPMHWLPIAIPYQLGIDIRWCGYGVLGIAIGIYGFHLAKKYGISLVSGFAIFLPSVVFWAFRIYDDSNGLCLTLETLIAGYYLIVVAGLLSKNIYLTALGISLCLLSRYTFIFWLPLFALLLWENEPKKVSFIFWASIAASVIGIYVIPFLSHDPSIFLTGIAYHNKCAVDEFEGFGNPPVSWTFINQIYYGKLLCDFLPGETMKIRVSYVRSIQLALMIFLNISGYIAYRKWKHLVDYRDFLVGMLFLFIFFFYFFCPLTYLYYYMVFLSLSAVLVGKICIGYGLEKRFRKEE
jgi:hypothetical protein